MRRTSWTLTALISSALAGCSSQSPTADAELASLFRPASAESTSSNAASDDPDEWTKAIEPREFEFPRDHGAHRDFRIEWWYYTGNLRTADGREFGYQLTFFRTGILKDPKNPSRWVVRDLYTAHFAVSDVAAEKHYSAQTSRRAGVDAAGASDDHLEVWNGDWRVEADGDAHRLIARSNDFAIDLLLEPGKGAVKHGDAGLSQKGAAEGNASYYYSFPRMPSTGTITTAGQSHQVTGTSWMDHEFSTSFLEEGQRGWDWFSIQFNDDTELMLYRMRRSDGSVDPYSSGSYVDAAGNMTHITSTEFTMTPAGEWLSDETGAEYPLEWTIAVPSLGLQLAAGPTFQAQEMATEATTGIAYWEGSIRVTGSRNDKPITGRGYLELTGYTERELGSLLGE